MPLDCFLSWHATRSYEFFELFAVIELLLRELACLPGLVGPVPINFESHYRLIVMLTMGELDLNLFRAPER